MLPKLRKSKLTPEAIKILYVVSLLTMEQIAEQAGVTKQAIKLILDRMGVEYRGGEVERVCEYCGLTFMHRRSEVKKGRGNHCSLQCYNSDRSLGGSMSVSSRLGRAALISAGVIIPDKAVVHHIDGNRDNNSLVNLQIFSSQREHMQYHHTLRHNKP